MVGGRGLKGGWGTLAFSGLDHTTAGKGVPWNPERPIKKKKTDNGISLLV